MVALAGKTGKVGGADKQDPTGKERPGFEARLKHGPFDFLPGRQMCCTLTRTILWVWCEMIWICLPYFVAVPND